jgi:3-dehydroquinate synthase
MKIRSKIKNYSLELVDDLLDSKDRLPLLKSKGRLFYFVDRRFQELYKEKLNKFIGNDFCLLIDAKEDNKSYLKIADYFRALIKAGFSRNDTLVTFGGGILQDISGFIASTLYRGINWVYVPTTLLAQADSCIGSKTSINFDSAKNLIGTFYPPDAIYLDQSFCDSLPDDAFNSGLGEIIKFHLLTTDQKRLDLLQKYLNGPDLRHSPLFKKVVLSSLYIKKSYFETEEFDKGRRNLLNYGHCFGHALESASHFGISHGEAVIVGMGFANALALKRGVLKKPTFDRIEAILKNRYPRFDFSKIDITDLIGYMKQDKKRAGKDLTMILPKTIGRHFKYTDVKESEVRGIYDSFVRQYPRLN